MSKVKERLEDFRPDQRLVDERGPTAERILRAAGAAVHGDTGTITVRQSTIDRALARGTLNEHQGRAAEKLYSHWKRGGMIGSVGFPSNWEMASTGPGRRDWLVYSEGATHDRKSFVRGMTSVRDRSWAAGHNGDHAVRILELVVLHETPFGEAGRSIGYGGLKQAENAAIIATRAGLNILIDEWGII